MNELLTSPTEQKNKTKDTNRVPRNDGRTVIEVAISCARLPVEAATFHAGHESAVIPNNGLIGGLDNWLGRGN